MGVEAVVQCSGSRHRVRLDENRLVLLDHDAEGELTLLALGGTPPMCVSLLDVWNRHRTDPVILESLIGADQPWARVRRPMQHARAAQGAGRNPKAEVDAAVAQLLAGLPVPFLQSLRTCVFTELESSRSDVGATDPALAGYLQSLVRGEAGPVIRDACVLSGRQSPTVSYQPCRPGDRPTIRGTVRGSTPRISVKLDLSWLRQVHWRGISLVQTGVVVELVHEGADELVVQAGRWSRGRLRESLAVVRRDDGPWSLDWLGPQAAMRPRRDV